MQPGGLAEKKVVDGGIIVSVFPHHPIFEK